MEDRAYWVGFNKVKGVGAVRLRGLPDFFGRLELAWQAPMDGLRAAGYQQPDARELESAQQDQQP